MPQEKYRKEVVLLTNRLNKVEAGLKEVSITISTTKETSNIYWARLQSETRKLYEESRIIFADWAKSNIPDAYKETLATQIKRIKNIKFIPPNPLTIRKFSNSDINKQTIASILKDSIASFYSGTAIGETKINRLMNLTQQINIEEKAVNKAIQQGFIEGAPGKFDPSKKVGAGSLYGVQRKLQNALMKDALNEQYIIVIGTDKFGNPKLINYNIKSYAKMVARTKLIECQSSATVNLSLGYGSGLVQVSSHNTMTPYDAEFEGKVYDLTGKNPNFPNATDLPPFHPNCMHTLTVFFEEALNENQAKKISDFSKGKTEIHPTRTGHIPVTDRLKFGQNKPEGISLPDWVKKQKTK